jgi:SAM-dependent methyltransferase
LLDLRGLLRHPAVYNLSQRVAGAQQAHVDSIRALEIGPDDRVLDVGCGPAHYLDHVPRCDYHGFDIDEDYIRHARERWGHRAKFYAETYGEAQRERLAPFDAILFMGLLHHLDDDTVHSLCDLAARSLGQGGRVGTLDPVLFPGQKIVPKLLASFDRGEHVRSPERLVALVEPHFATVNRRLVGGTWKLPPQLLIMTLSEPRNAGGSAAP